MTVVAADEVAGFAAFGRCQDDGASPEEGQLYAINLDPTHWGKGLGRERRTHRRFSCARSNPPDRSANSDVRSVRGNLFRC
jgi:hypothetical protein